MRIIKWNDFVRNILQNRFYAYFYILPSGTRRCTPNCGATMLLRRHWCRNLDAVNCILHWIVLTLSTLHTRNRSCITLLWLHHNHKMFISYHKNGFSQLSPIRWQIVYFNVFCSKNILTKLVGYQQPTCPMTRWNLWLEPFRFHVNCFHFLKSGPTLSGCIRMQMHWSPPLWGPRAMAVRPGCSFLPDNPCAKEL